MCLVCYYTESLFKKLRLYASINKLCMPVPLQCLNNYDFVDVHIIALLHLVEHDIKIHQCNEMKRSVITA